MSHPENIHNLQLKRLQEVLAVAITENAFYGPRITAAGIDPSTVTLTSFVEMMPFTTRADWVQDQLDHPPYGTNLSFPRAAYNRFCRTSGSTGTPMHWLDTPASWSAMLDGWEEVFRQSGVTDHTSIFFAFSFGPFLGFWTAYEAAARAGHLVIPGGGLSSAARLQVMRDTKAKVLCCTPTYALRLAEVARAEGVRIADDLQVHTLILAGEPGASIPAVRARLEAAWPAAAVCDHHGMTEVGPVTWQRPNEPDRLTVMEDQFLTEVIDDELVLTTLTRTGSPLFRYRTGDRVQAVRCTDGRLQLVGGILGRLDDMVVIRGVNLFPSALEGVIRRMPEVAEFRCHVEEHQSMLEVRIEIEPEDNAEPVPLCRRLESILKEHFALRIPVTAVASESLPRFEMKANRWIRHDR